MEKLFCKGFTAAGVASGLKKKGGLDLGMICSQIPSAAAAVFTKNLVRAAPVLLDMARITSGVCKAVIVNSGNANCCVGDRGMRDAVAMSKYAADELGVPEETVLVASTGVIGAPLPIEKVGAAVPDLVRALSADGLDAFAASIMTTDTVPKIVSVRGEHGGKWFTVVGVAKGSGMISPDMATMLCFVCSDIGASPETLKRALVSGVDRSFNRTTVDGDTSTNDTVILMANGMSGVSADTPESEKAFRNALDRVLLDLAKMVVRDGEGATKFVEIAVTGAQTDADAFKIADTIANSNLVKTALFGEDANWGRIMGAVGRAGVDLDPDRIDIRFDDVFMAKNGAGCGDDAETEATKVLKKSEFVISVDLKSGNGSASVFTCDFSLDYVRINADYRS